MLKRHISIAICILMCLAAFSSCTKDPESGSIKDVQIDNKESERDSSGIFTKTESPYDYEYKTFVWEKAHIEMEIPSTWDVSPVNSRYLSIQVPGDDGFIPGASMAFLADYGANVDKDDMSQYTMNDHAYKFSSLFKNELEGIPYYIGGSRYHLRKYVAEDEINNGLDFVAEDHAKDAATLTTNKVVLMDKASKYYSGYGMVASYFKWDHVPFCFSAVAPKASLGNTREMLEHIISSITYAKGTSEGYKDVSYEDFVTRVPVSFTPVQGAENVYISDLTENRDTAGMSVGVFKIEKADGMSDLEMVQKYYAQPAAGLAFGPYRLNAIYDISAMDSVSDSDKITLSVGVNCTGYEDPAEVAGTVFGPYAYYKGDFYIKDKSDDTYLVAVFYQDNQKSIAEAVGKTAVRNLRFD